MPVRSFEQPEIITVNGEYFQYADRWDQRGTDIESIAHALANTCRFCGHVKRFCSVAEHSVWVSYLAKEHPFSGLMHDTSEAYLTDVPSPIKAHINGYKDWENFLMERLASFYGFQYPLPDDVKYADAVMLVTEAKHNTAAGDDDSWRNWNIGVEPLGNLRVPLGWSPEKAKQQFLLRFNSLTDRRSP